jgi:hypothetical protein
VSVRHEAKSDVATWRTARQVRTSGPREFFRWRLAHAPDAPTQAELYRLFDGGFGEALAGAELRAA